MYYDNIQKKNLFSVIRPIFNNLFAYRFQKGFRSMKIITKQRANELAFCPLSYSFFDSSMLPVIDSIGE